MAAILQTFSIRIFLNDNHCMFIAISLKFVPKGSIDNKLELVQIMAWRQIGADVYMCHLLLVLIIYWDASI